MKTLHSLGSAIAVVFVFIAIGCRGGDVGTERRLDWAADFGSDSHGDWADVQVEGVVQRLRWIPPGTYQRGSPASEEGRFDNEAQHQVTLTQGYWLASTECTQALWAAVMGTDPSESKDPQGPVEMVNWMDVQEFLRRLNDRIPSLQARLPTEAEWEYAARAGTTDARYGDLDTIAWRGLPSRTSNPVGRKQPNAWGLYDMIGHVYEWCSDWYGDYPTGAVTDPIGPASGLNRVLRGGGWGANARHCRAAYRIGVGPGRRNSGFGFRFLAQASPATGAENP